MSNDSYGWPRALVYAAGLLLVHLVLSTAYTRVIGPRHKAWRSDRLWEMAPQQVDVVFLGDSHPRSGIDPRIMGPTWINLATGGEHYTKSYYRFKTLYESSDRDVRVVVIPLDPNGFTSWHADQFAPEYVWGKYVDYWKLGRLRHEEWTFAAKWAKANIAPYTGELRTFNQLRSKRFGFGEALASGRFDWLGPAAREHAAREQAEVHFEGFDHMDPNQKLGFDLLIDWAESEGIQVVALSYPLTDPYLRVIEEELGDPAAAVRAGVIDKLPEEHPNVIHLDYTRFYFGQPDLFADPHHLNRAGRVLFTREVARELAERGLIDEAGL